MTGRRRQSANENELNSSNHLGFLQEDDLGMSKICVICNEDCSNEPRFKNEDGQYLHQSCHLSQQATNKEKSSLDREKTLTDPSGFIRPNQPRTWQNRLIGVLLMLTSVYLIAKLYPNLSNFHQYLDERKPVNMDEGEPLVITISCAVLPLILGIYGCCCLSKRFTKRLYVWREKNLPNYGSR